MNFMENNKLTQQVKDEIAARAKAQQVVKMQQVRDKVDIKK